MSGEPWRIGSHYGVHVYRGDEPIATFHDPADARRAVEAVNAASQSKVKELPFGRCLLCGTGPNGTPHAPHVCGSDSDDPTWCDGKAVPYRWWRP